MPVGKQPHLEDLGRVLRLDLAGALALADEAAEGAVAPVPSVAAMLYAEGIGQRLAIGWTMGTIVSVLGMYFSVQFDMPTGATIVCTFGAVLIAMAALRPLLRLRAA